MLLELEALELLSLELELVLLSLALLVPALEASELLDLLFPHPATMVAAIAAQRIALTNFLFIRYFLLLIWNMFYTK